LNKKVTAKVTPYSVCYQQYRYGTMGITKCCYTHGEGGGPLSKWELYAHSYCALLHDVHEINVPMMKEAVSTVETSVSFCQTTRHNIPEDNYSP
jgi:hypothetical protein